MNDNQQPLLIAGKLPKEEYKDLQEFVNDLVKVLLFPLDAVAIIKGANGERGLKGDRGVAGPAGPTGPGATKTGASIAIPDGATYVDFDYFLNWQEATYTIVSTGVINPIDTEDEFVPADGWIGVGTIVPIAAVPSPTKLRCYFVFGGGATAVNGDFFVLKHTSIS